MNPEEVVKILKETGALLDGHFQLTSGLHSPQYIEKFRLLERPEYTEKLCKGMADMYRNEGITLVCGPMTGGILLSYETAKSLGTRMIFTERLDGKMTLRRGFRILPEDRILIVEDIVTTGSSIIDVINVIRELECTIVGIASLVDRSSGKVSFPYPFKTLLRLDIATYTADKCPLCKKDIPLTKPGSTNK